MKVVVWTLAGILALNLLVVGLFAIFAAVRRYRTDREIWELEELWGTSAAFATVGAARRSAPRRLVGVTLAAAVAFAGVAQAIPGARRVVTSAIGVVVPVLRLDPAGHPTSSVGPAGNDPISAPAGDLTPRRGASATHGHPGAPSPGSSAASSTATSDDPSVPASVSAVPHSSTAIGLVWAEVPAATGYQIERSDDGATEWIAIATTEHDVTTYVDAGLSSGTTYFYRIMAVTGSGEAPPSDVVSATTAIDPAEPTAATATATSSTEIDLVWVDVADETGYRVERSADGATGWITIATTGQDVTSYTDAGLSAGTTYYYRVFATNAGADSPPSEVISAATAADPVLGPDAEPVPDPDVTDPGSAEVSPTPDASA